MGCPDSFGNDTKSSNLFRGCLSLLQPLRSSRQNITSFSELSGKLFFYINRACKRWDKYRGNYIKNKPYIPLHVSSID